MKRIFVLLITILIVVAFAGCQAPQGPTVEETPIPTTPTTITTPITTPTTPATPPTTPTPPLVTQPFPSQVNCTMCHKKSEEYSAHKEGSGCIKCHGSDPHEIHVGEGTINLECTICHGPVENLTIPRGPGGQPSCVNCHDSVNPVAPFKNYVNVHLPRGKYCTVCHTEKVSEIHKKADQYV